MILVLVLVPVGLSALLTLVIYRKKGPHPATYKMSEPWQHAPILWAAEEPSLHAGATGHSPMADSAAHGGNVGDTHSNPVTVGGGASGKW